MCWGYPLKATMPHKNICNRFCESRFFSKGAYFVKQYHQCFMFLSTFIFTFSSIFATPSASIPFSNLGTEADKKVTSQEVAVTAEGLKISAPLQKLEAYITTKGATIRSISETEGKGIFSVNPVAFGRISNTETIAATGIVSSQDAHSVLIDREKIIEQFSSSADGIRQNFVIAKRPAGKGKLLLELAVNGARASMMKNNIELTIATGRRLLYGKLKAIDAKGKTLNAGMKAMSGNLLKISVDDTGADYPVVIDPTIFDEDWIEINNRWIWSGLVKTFAYSKECIYAGGDLTAGFKHHIAKWDGNRWGSIALGDSVDINAMACDSAENLYVAGVFNAIGNFAAKNIAKWDGSRWRQLGAGLNGEIFSLAVDSTGAVFAGGSFRTAGEDSVEFIAGWDGKKWNALGTGMNGYVRALVANGKGNLYAGGDFDVAGNVYSRYVAKWDGSDWIALDSGVVGVNGSVYALTLDMDGHLIAGGDYTQTSTISSYSFIAKWNDSAWNNIGSVYSAKGNEGVYALSCDKNGNLYVAGKFSKVGSINANNIAKWNGVVWDSLGSGTDSTVYALACVGNNTVYAGGCIDTLRYQNIKYTTSLISVWTDTGWNDIGSTKPNACIKAIASDHAGNIYVGGTFSSIGGKKINNIARWDGSAWYALDSGSNSEIKTLAVDKNNNLYAGGGFSRIGGISASYVAMWNGTSWCALGSGMNNAVNSLVSDGGDNIYAGGYFTKADTIAAKYITKWDGTKWNTLDSGLNSYCYSLSYNAQNGHLAAGCGATVWEWNGNEWNKIGSGSYIYALVYDNGGNLYLGDFSSYGVYKWNGQYWSCIGSCGGGTVYSLTTDPAGNIYAGGRFSTMGDLSTNNIACWNGNQWLSLGSSGADDIVYSLAFRDSSLYAGGAFGMAGDAISQYIARVDINAGSSKASAVIELFYPKAISYRISKSTLTMSNIALHDQISIFSLSGCLLREAEGVSAVKLTGIAPQQLLIRINREGKIISTGMVMVQ
jgi:trimeric autotransporter adhesin